MKKTALVHYGSPWRTIFERSLLIRREIVSNTVAGPEKLLILSQSGLHCSVL